MSFEEIKKRLEQMKLESAKAEVRIQQIKERWRANFGTDDFETVKQKITELGEDLKKSREDYMDALEKAENELLKLESN